MYESDRNSILNFLLHQLFVFDHFLLAHEGVWPKAV